MNSSNITSSLHIREDPPVCIDWSVGPVSKVCANCLYWEYQHGVKTVTCEKFQHIQCLKYVKP